MKSLVLAVLIALLAAPAAHAQSVSVSDPADTPASPYDVEHVRVDYDAGSGAVQVTWRLAQPLPLEFSNIGGPSLSTQLAQQRKYGCWSDNSPGDVTISVHLITAYDAPSAWRGRYEVKGRAGTTETAAAIAPDRRELTVALSDPALTGRSYFCAITRSSAGLMIVADRRDDEVIGHFPGFEPAAPVLGGAPDGAVFRGTNPPPLTWDRRFSEAEWFELYDRDPASGASSLGSIYTTGRMIAGIVPGTVTATSFTLTSQLDDGVYWWGVRRYYGSAALTRYHRFEIGPPDLTRLVVTPRIKPPASAKKAGSARLTIDATRGASGTLVVRRGAKVVRTSRFTVGTDEAGAVKPVRATLPLSCRTPGRHTATVEAADRYGARMKASRSWTVSKRRCARLRRAAAEQRRKRASRPRPSGGCMSGYSPCLPVTGDLDCGEIPESKKPVTVTGSDPYRLDADDDGIGCE